MRLSRKIVLLGALLASIPHARAADSTVAAMTAGSAISGTDLFYCSQAAGTNDRKCTGTQILTWVQAGWGTGSATAIANAVNTNGGLLTASTAAIAANALVTGAGSGTALTGTTPGTGVLTALGVNVGSAGAFVVNGGALGTPASGTATNLTGLPISTGVSGLGTGNATALAVNVGSAGAFVRNNAAETISGALTLTSAAPQITAGVNATTLGSIKLFGNTSGDLTLQPTAAAGTASVATFPARSGTVAYTSGALTSGNCAKFDASGNIVDNGAVCGGGGGGTPGGSDTQVQFNDGGAFGGDASFTWNKTTNLLTLSGSLTGSDATSNLEITPTWNTSGSPAALKVNVTNTASGSDARLADFKVGGTSLAYIKSNGRMGVAAGDYTVPAPSIFSTSSVNTGIDFRGSDSIDFYVAGTAYFAANANGLQMKSDGMLAVSSGNPVTTAPDTFLGRNAAATWRFGNVDAASPVAQAIQVQNVVAGTSNTAGANFVIRASKGTGNGVAGDIIFSSAVANGSATAQNVGLEMLRIKGSASGDFNPGRILVSGQIESSGAQPTAAGSGGTCATGAIAGGANAGTVTLTAACAATNTVTLTFKTAAATGWSCFAMNRNTPANLMQETSTSTTTAVLTAAGTTSGATDVIQYACTAY